MPYIGKRLKGFESTSHHKGAEFEAIVSRWVHCSTQEKIPLLISGQLLRRRGLGQIDVACLSIEGIELYECKSNNQMPVSWKQKKRLRNAASFLSLLFEKYSCKLFLVQLMTQRADKFAKINSEAYPLKVIQMGQVS